MIDRQQLNQIRVASPCSASWDEMKGDDQVRHCGECDLNVYNLSAMSLDEISQLLARKEGRTCVRFYRRADGTVLTDDCPVGLRKIRRRIALMSATAGAVLTAAIAGFAFARGAMARTLRSTAIGRIAIVRALADWMEPEQRHSVVTGAMPPPRFTMGKPVAPPSGCSVQKARMGEPVMGDVEEMGRK